MGRREKQGEVYPLQTNLTFNNELKTLWETAAKNLGISLSDWLRYAGACAVQDREAVRAFLVGVRSRRYKEILEEKIQAEESSGEAEKRRQLEKRIEGLRELRKPRSKAGGPVPWGQE